ncbi:MAG: PorP/SprF family type IX secretion system membrane protein, partial [Flavobacteriaceae bacterium]|nr:PorP/SprF family type IX secretion system membrane protein [Flavobacteriaceae bacterium]
MPKPFLIFLLFLCITIGKAQEVSLPTDFRQHNLNQFNSSLFNPVFTLDRNNPQSLSIWSRWQWQQPDADPTTLFANYTHKLNTKSSFGIGFLQQNTGVFLQTGGVLNYAYDFEIAPDVFLALGINLFGYSEELADDRFQQSPNINLPFRDGGPEFILQAAPGIRLAYKNFSLGFTAENALVYNLSPGDNNDGDAEKIFLGSASYSLPVNGTGILENAHVRPMLYVKTIPEMDAQYGINTLFASDKIWIQGGYHNFYGFSGGIGGTFFKRFSVGALVEIGNSTELEGKDPTFEIVTSYQFAKPDPRRKIVGFEIEENEMQEEVTEVPKEKKLSRKERKALALIAEKEKQDSLIAVQQRDSVSLALRRAEEEESKRLAAELQRKKDSVAAVALKDEAEARKKQLVEPQKGERFEEAVLTEDIRPGFYLIVNVFGTQRYYNSFMESLRKKGIEPKSFYRTQRKLNYVYLQRYDSMAEARKARDSKFNGKYSETIWIFRVRG